MSIRHQAYSLGRSRRLPGSRQSFRSGRWQRGRVPTGANPEEAAKVAIARRAKPGAPPDHVRLVLTLELRRALAEHLSAEAIRSGRNLEAVVIDMLEAGVTG